MNDGEHLLGYCEVCGKKIPENILYRVGFWLGLWYRTYISTKMDPYRINFVFRKGRVATKCLLCQMDKLEHEVGRLRPRKRVKIDPEAMRAFALMFNEFAEFLEQKEKKV